MKEARPGSFRRAFSIALAAALLAAIGASPPTHADDATARLQAMAAAERAAEKRWQDAERAKREYQRRSAAAHARMRMRGVSTMHASTPSPPNGAMCLAPGVEPARFSPVASAGGTSASSDAAAFTRGASTQTASHFRTEATISTLGLRRPSSTHSLLDTPATSPLRERRVSFLPAASREPAQRGILRLTNRDGRPAIVSITAFDDTGRRFGAISLPLEAGHTAEISSSDIEQGNPIKGLPRGIGSGQGDWRLVLQSSAKLDALAYAESAQGLRTPLRNIAPAPDELRHVPLFPAADGLLRLSNPGTEAVEARIRARDDAGRLSEVRATLPPGTSRWLAASALESGQGVPGALGEGTGDWRLAIHAPAAVQALALSSSAGELGNLHTTRWRSSGPAPPLEGRHSAFPSADRRFPASCAPDGAQGKAECLPSNPSLASRGQPVAEDAQTAWLPPATPGEALLRIASRSPRPGTATLHQAGDRPQEPLTLHLGANGATTLTASDLEFGNPAKGLAQGFGATSGNRRVTVRSQLELDVLSYVRSPSGTVSAAHDTAPRAAPNRHVVAMFPAGAGDAEGRLLLTNRSDAQATIHIKGVDDEGRASQPATLTLPANATQTLTSAQLAWGAPELDGWLGAGRGHWRLSIWSDAPLDVTGLLGSRTGGLANISAASSSTSANQRLPHPIGDLNGDGMDDVLLRHVDGRWMYYPMNGRTPIESERGTVALERSASWQLAGIGDMDGDGRDDILLRHTDGRWKGYLMDGKTVLDSGSITGLPTDPVWNVAGLGDLGGDGKTDVVLRHPDGGWLHAPLDGLAVMPNIAVEPNLTKSVKWSVAGIADLNGDNKDDILLRHDDGRWHYYPMNGSLSGPGRGSVSGVTKSLDWQLAGLGDLNGDGRDDILLRHVEGRWTHHPMNGRNVTAGKGGVPLTPNTAWRMAGVGDLNGDGNDDALLRHEDGRWTYYPLNGMTILAGRGSAGITRNPDWSTKGPEPGPDEAEAGTPEDDETAESLFHASIASIVETKCATCHRDGGVSGNTRLIFAAGANQQTANLTTFEDFLANVDEGATLILNKVQGVSHGGGIQLAVGTDGFAAMERFLGLLGVEPSPTAVTPATLFDTVQTAPHSRTLRRAAILFAGRNPTDAEVAALRKGAVSVRAAIRALMQGPTFHEFLLRATNDRLLTKHPRLVVIDPDDYFARYAQKFNECIERTGDCDYVRWVYATEFGVRFAPLELVAHVVENDLPYTQILTADYIMANSFADDIYGPSGVQFNDPDDPFEFRPSKITSYYRMSNRGANDLRTDIPHAGVLNTNVFLARYPTTATNRNRARSRWTYYHFLGLDIEKSASRTTDPVALADTNNPTLNNPACTVCHQILDPVAGAYQNYGDSGYFRVGWGGLDSLAEFYKHPPDGSASPYVTGDTWYRDMRPPGFDGALVPDADTSLQWLASRIVADRRFAEATVKFWWPAVMGVQVAEPPEDVGDADFAGRLLASNAQAAEVTRLARAFHRGIRGGEPYNLKDLLVEIVLSPWFRAGAMTDRDPVRRAALRHAGADRLLTPEELARKTEAITGLMWGRWVAHEHDPYQVDQVGYGLVGALNQQYRLLYGGIDSAGVVDRATETTALMTAVAVRHAADLSRVIVLRELYLLKDGNRRLFDGVDASVSPAAEAQAVHAIKATWPRTESVAVPGSLTAGTKTVALTFTNGFWDEGAQAGRHLMVDRLDIRDAAGALLSSVEIENVGDYLLSPDGCGDRMDSGFIFFACSNAQLRFDIDVPSGARIEVVAGGEAHNGLPELAVSVESPTILPANAAAIRRKLQELHRDLLGVTVADDSADVEEAFALFDEVRRSEAQGSEYCSWPVGGCDWSTDQRFFDGIVDDPPLLVRGLDNEPRYEWDWERGDELIGSTPDPHGVARSWAAVLALLMTDPRYLQL